MAAKTKLPLSGKWNLKVSEGQRIRETRIWKNAPPILMLLPRAGGRPTSLIFGALVPFLVLLSGTTRIRGCAYPTGSGRVLFRFGSSY